MSEPTRCPRALLRSGLSEENLSLRDARLLVVSPSEVPSRPPFRGSIRLARLDEGGDVDAIRAINLFFWGEMSQYVFDKSYEILDCMTYLAVPAPDEVGADDPRCHGIAGAISLFRDEGFLHIVALQVWPSWQGRGVGSTLLGKAFEEAEILGYRCVKLGTTNDNLPALYFYQRAGFVIDEIVPFDEDDSEEGAGGFAGIPIKKEIRLSKKIAVPDLFKGEES